ncbi:MAG: hypothetical protein Q9195_006765 [Heterodermia aff. obscurata]
MLKLFPLPLEKGEVYISINKHFNPHFNAFLPGSSLFVYTARAYTIEDNEIAIVRSDAWATFGEAIQQLLADVKLKTMIKEKDPEDSALHESQIWMPLQRSYKEYCKHEEKFLWPEMAAEMLAESQGAAVNVADYQVPAPLPQGLVDNTALLGYQGGESVARGYDVGIPLPQGLVDNTAFLGYQGDGSVARGYNVGIPLPQGLVDNTALLGYQGDGSVGTSYNVGAALPPQGFIDTSTAGVGYQGNVAEHQAPPLPFQGFIDGTALGGYQGDSGAGYLPPQGTTVGYQPPYGVAIA